MTEPRAVAILYTALIDVAGKIMGRPSFAAGGDELETLQTAIVTAARGAAEDGSPRIHDEEALLAQCLLSIVASRRAGDRDRERFWTQIAGVLLPVVKEHFGEAVMAERRARPSTSDGAGGGPSR